MTLDSGTQPAPRQRPHLVVPTPEQLAARRLRRRTRPLRPRYWLPFVLLVVALGFGMGPKVVLTALVCFFPILINVATGLRAVPSPVLQVYRTVAASRLEVLRHLRVPASLPYVFASLRIVFPLSMIGAVVAELSAAGSADGLGSVIQVASSQNRLATVWAAIFVLAALGSLLFWLVTLAERRVLHWHES